MNLENVPLIHFFQMFALNLVPAQFGSTQLIKSEQKKNKSLAMN